MKRILVWDFPTRAFHWSLVALIFFAWLSGENEWLDWHQWAGQAVLALIAFRLLWGFFGSRYALFSNFVKGVSSVTSYLVGLLKGDKGHWIGHNPLGGWSVIALLGFIAFQSALGLFALTDDFLYEGPLAPLVSDQASEDISAWHEDLFDIMLILIAIHVMAILFYLIRFRTNLVRPMVTGYKDNQPEEDGIEPPSPILAAILFIACFAAAFSIPYWV